jgi:hypothetical protein
MDPTLLQLFTPEEILARLGQKKSTGCLHLYTTKQAANIFLKDGVVTATSNGSAEGVEVLKQVLAWKDVYYVWHPDATAPAASFKPLHVPVHDILAQLRTSSDPNRQGVTVGRASDVLPKAGLRTTGALPKAAKATGSIPSVAGRASGTLPAPKATSSPPVYQSIGAKGTTTAPLDLPAHPKASAPLAEATTPSHLSATKSINANTLDRAVEEAALLKKHRLVLVSTDNPEWRLRITQISGLLGRNPACELSIPHPSISRQHCVIQLTDRGLNVKDLGTTNGTKVNGISLGEGYVNVGDKLTFGHLTFQLERDKE